MSNRSSVILTPQAPPFQVLKVTGTDIDRSATYDCLLMFHSNYSPFLYHFGDKGRYLQNFPILLCIYGTVY